MIHLLVLVALGLSISSTQAAHVTADDLGHEVRASSFVCTTRRMSVKTWQRQTTVQQAPPATTLRPFVIN